MTNLIERNDKFVTVHNKCSKIPPRTSAYLAIPVQTLDSNSSISNELKQIVRLAQLIFYYYIRGYMFRPYLYAIFSLVDVFWCCLAGCCSTSIWSSRGSLLNFESKCCNIRLHNTRIHLQDDTTNSDRKEAHGFPTGRTAILWKPVNAGEYTLF